MARAYQCIPRTLGCLAGDVADLEKLRQRFAESDDPFELEPADHHGRSAVVVPAPSKPSASQGLGSPAVSRRRMSAMTAMLFAPLTTWRPKDQRPASGPVWSVG